MSAECDKCGQDLVYGEETWPVGECPVCPLRERLARFDHLTELAHNWRNSDEWIGSCFRAIVGRGDGLPVSPSAASPVPEEQPQ